MSRVQPSESGIAIDRMIAKTRRSGAPVKASVRDGEIVVVVMPKREYEKMYAIRKAVQRLVTRPAKTLEGYLAETTRTLRRYEKKYGMTSAEFYRRFQAGKLDETEDFFDWRVEYGSFCRMKKRVANAKRQTA